MAQTALTRSDARLDALRATVTELLSMDEPRKRLAGMITGLDVHYDLGEGHPLLGRRMPDLDLVTADGSVRVYSLLHDARPVLIDLGDVARKADRVRLVEATYGGPWELPVLGEVPAPTAVLIPTRRACRLGGRRHRYRVARRADYLARTPLVNISPWTRC